MSLKDRIKDRLESKPAGQMNLSRDLLPSDYQARLKKFIADERLQELYHEVRKGHYVEIDVTPQKMAAYLSVYTNREKLPLTREDLQMVLAAAGVSSGILENELRRNLDKNVLKQSVLGVQIARGTRPLAGRAGFIELLRRPYNARVSNALLSFDPVNEDEEIARVHPPERGTPGVDILGQEVPCAMTAEAEYRLNHLIKSLKLGNDTSLIAAAKGHIVQDGQSLILYEVLTLNDDITTHSGALIYNNDVSVYGSICENTSLNIEGSLMVRDMISSSQIRVGGNLEVVQGVFGRGNANIQVGGSVKARYINDASVFSGGPILLVKEALNSTLWSKANIDGPSTVIVGGRTFAQGGIDALSLGSELGLTGLVVVGLDYQEYRIEKELKPKVAGLVAIREEAAAEFKKSSPKMKKVLLERINDLSAEIENRENEIVSLTQHLSPRSEVASIRVRQTVHPGVKLMIGFSELDVREKIEGPVEFYLEREAVKLRRINLRD